MSLSVRDAAVLMSVLSDNTATNLLLDRVAIRRVWQKMESLGLGHTKVHSKTFLRITSVAMDSSVKYGLGVSTPNEMARLFGLLASGKAVTPSADSAMLDILRSNADGELMQRTVEGGSASQDGSDRFGPHGVRAIPAPVARCRLRIHQAESRHSMGGRQRGPSDPREAGRGGRRRLAKAVLALELALAQIT